jgi:hypothetical protein
MNGCLNLNRGCRGERRASGRGEVAVVLCDKRVDQFAEIFQRNIVVRLSRR